MQKINITEIIIGSNNIKVTKMGIPDLFVQHGTRNELLEELGSAAALAIRS